MNLIAIVIGLFITGILTFYELRGDTATLHQANLTALEASIQSLQQASIQYANINGSYAGLSCPSLQADNLWSTNTAGCSGNGITTRFSAAGITVTPAPVNNNANFEIVISGNGVVGGAMTSDAYTMLWEHFASETDSVPGCTSGVSGSSVTLCY